MTELYIDGSEHVLGRLASGIAKKLLNGDSIFVVNAENIVVSGSHQATFSFFKTKIERGDPYHGPFYPNMPDRIVKRVVRTMLPKNYRGREALKRLRVYLSVPEDLKGKKFGSIKYAENKLSCKFVKLGRVTEVVSNRKIAV